MTNRRPAALSGTVLSTVSGPEIYYIKDEKKKRENRAPHELWHVRPDEK